MLYMKFDIQWKVFYIFMLGIYGKWYSNAYLMGFKILDQCIEFCHGFSMSMCIWMLLMHWKRFHGFWNLVWGFELLSSLKTVFWDFGSLVDSSGSVRRKCIPQIRAREDNQCGYRGSPGLVKMDLTRVLTRVLAIGFWMADLLLRQIGRPICQIGRPIVGLL